jgi:hypothetical protein
MSQHFYKIPKFKHVDPSQQVKNQNDDMHTSQSGFLSTLLSWVSRQANLLRERGFYGRVKDLFKRILRRLTAFVKARPKLKRFSVLVLNKLGCLGIVLQHQRVFAPKFEVQKKQTFKLTPRAKCIYADLKAATARHNQTLK